MKNNCQNDERLYSGCAIPPDAHLIAEGWERRYIADVRMAQEAVETYTELGYEVRLEPVNTNGLQEECSGCKVVFEQFKMVYTRKK